MTRSELIGKLAEERGLTHRVAESVIETIFMYMTEMLIAGGRIEIRGFGSFEIREYKERTARNPKSGKVIQVGHRRAPFFKVGKELKERVDA